MINQQKLEPPVRGEDGEWLDFHSMFFTLQGEGPYSGHRAVFIRLAGCNLQCPGCDTEYTAGRQRLPAVEIANAARGKARDWGDDKCLVVITGGEPLRQPIGLLVSMLLLRGHRVQIESNGTCGPDPVLHDWLTGKMIRHGLHRPVLVVSPKTKSIHPNCYELATTFKYVVDYRHLDPADGLPTVALEHARGGGVARPRPGAPVYLTPFDAEGDVELDAAEMLGLNLSHVAKSCMAHGYIAGVQLHKQLGMP